jgi:hypothetical protein
MPLQASLPRSAVNVPRDYFSMAGFEVTLYGRFWVTPEEIKALAEGLALCFTQDDTTRSRIETESCLFSTAEVDVT